jgi:integrase/recombinase XerD
MSELGQAVDSYLAVRRALGFKLDRTEHELRRFVDYAQEQQSPTVTTALALAWASRSNNAAAVTHAKRLTIVRGFARHLHASDPRHEVPPADLIPHHRIRHEPYIYADEDVAALLEAAHGIRHPLKAATYITLLGLLAVTGMRLGEALALDDDDVDLDDAVLFIRNSKFQKSRHLPLHSTTRDVLRNYADKRGELLSRPRAQSFLVSTSGSRLISQNVHTTFWKLLLKAGLYERRPRRPRIHDLRHSFAVKTVRRWYEAGLDVEQRLPSLSTYLGHVAPSATYWYLTATPGLMLLAAKRLEAARGKLP